MRNSEGHLHRLRNLRRLLVVHLEVWLGHVVREHLVGRPKLRGGRGGSGPPLASRVHVGREDGELRTGRDGCGEWRVMFRHESLSRSTSRGLVIGA